MCPTYNLRLHLFFILLSHLAITSCSGQNYDQDNSADSFLSSFNLDQLSLKDFLSVITGVIKVGNHTITFPEDLPKLFGNSDSIIEKRRGFANDDGDERIKIKVKYDLGGGGGWGWGPRGKGLISLSNFFRVGCILFDLQEIKNSASHGMY